MKRANHTFHGFPSHSSLRSFPSFSRHREEIICTIRKKTKWTNQIKSSHQWGQRKNEPIISFTSFRVTFPSGRIPSSTERTLSELLLLRSGRVSRCLLACSSTRHLWRRWYDQKRTKERTNHNESLIESCVMETICTNQISRSSQLHSFWTKTPCKFR